MPLQDVPEKVSCPGVMGEDSGVPNTPTEKKVAILKTTPFPFPKGGWPARDRSTCLKHSPRPQILAPLTPDNVGTRLEKIWEVLKLRKGVMECWVNLIRKQKIVPPLCIFFFLSIASIDRIRYVSTLIHPFFFYPPHGALVYFLPCARKWQVGRAKRSPRSWKLSTSSRRPRTCSHQIHRKQ